MLAVHAAQAVADLHREDFVMALARSQCLHIGSAVVQRIGPIARVAVQRQRPVGASGRTVDRPGLGGGMVDIARRDRAARRQRAVFLRRARLRLARDHRRVVGARDSDRDLLVGHAAQSVARLHVEHFGMAFALRQILVRGVVQRVSPLAGVVHRKRAVDARRASAPGHRRARIDVRRSQRAARRERGVLFRRACVVARREADHRRVICAGYIDSQRRRRGGSVLVRQRVAKRVLHGLSRSQRLHIGLTVGEGVGIAAVRVQHQRAIGPGSVAVERYQSGNVRALRVVADHAAADRRAFLRGAPDIGHRRRHIVDDIDR